MSTSWKGNQTMRQQELPNLFSFKECQLLQICQSCWCLRQAQHFLSHQYCDTQGDVLKPTSKQSCFKNLHLLPEVEKVSVSEILHTSLGATF